MSELNVTAGDRARARAIARRSDRPAFGVALLGVMFGPLGAIFAGPAAGEFQARTAVAGLCAGLAIAVTVGVGSVMLHRYRYGRMVLDEVSACNDTDPDRTCAEALLVILEAAPDAYPWTTDFLGELLVDLHSQVGAGTTMTAAHRCGAMDDLGQLVWLQAVTDHLRVVHPDATMTSAALVVADLMARDVSAVDIRRLTRRHIDAHTPVLVSVLERARVRDTDKVLGVLTDPVNRQVVLDAVGEV